LLTNQGEISCENKQNLIVQAHTVGLEEADLDCLISEIESKVKDQISPLKNWLASLEKQVLNLENDTNLKKTFTESGEAIGLTDDQITVFFKQKYQSHQINSKKQLEPELESEQKELVNSPGKLRKYLNSILQLFLSYKNKIIFLCVLVALTFTSISWIEHFQLEENAWQQAKDTNDIDSYENFSQSFSNGAYDELAQSRTDEIIHKAWMAVKVKNSEKAYLQYIESNAQSPYLKHAQDNLKGLRQEKQKKINQQDESAWHQAKLADSEESYKNYLLEIQQGKYVSHAKNKLSNLILIRKNQSIELDNKAWRLAIKNNTELSYSAYLQSNPNGQYRDKASDKVAQFKNKRTFLQSFDVQFVMIPSGPFQMGSKSLSSYEVPIHTVNITSFKLMSTEVTFALWRDCFEDKACQHMPKGFISSQKKPVVNISWNEITKQFIPWFNNKTGQNYRLPSEAEWEYAARAGSYDNYSWGDRINCSQARFGYYSNQCEKQKYPDDVKSYEKNYFGLFDMHGNVKELVQDCWNDNFKNAPSDGSAWLTGRCDKAVVKGGSYKSKKSQLRLGVRYRHDKNARFDDDGFRLAQGL